MRALRLLLALTAAAGCGSSGSNMQADAGSMQTQMPQPVARGTSTGAQTTAMIGAAGGSLSSGDGAFTLAVPPGALASDVLIGLEPITNTAGLGVGTAYRLTPEGTKFSKPATVTFSFTAEDVAGAGNDALSVGYQSADGYWHMMAKSSVDGGAMTVSTTTTHFSDWGKVLGWQIQPPSPTVQPNGQVMLELIYCGPETFDDPEGGDSLSGLVPNCGLRDLPPLVVVNGWEVNGGAGSSASGTVSADPDAPAFATYTAPSSIPAQNPVAVSVNFSPTSKPGTTKQLAVSNIQVLGGGLSGTASWTATGSLSVMSGSGTFDDPTEVNTIEVSGGGMFQFAPGPNLTMMTGITGSFSYTRHRQEHAAGGPPSCPQTEDAVEDEMMSGTLGELMLEGGLTLSIDPSDGTLHALGFFPEYSVPHVDTLTTTTTGCGDPMTTTNTSTEMDDLPVWSTEVAFTSKPDGQTYSGTQTGHSEWPIFYNLPPIPIDYTITWSLTAK